MVAGFIGRGAVVEGRVAGGERDSRCPVEVFGMTVALRCRPGQSPGPASLCLRPEDLELARDGIPGRVRKATYKGGVVTIEVAPDVAPTASLIIEQPSAPEPGTAVAVRIRDGWVIPD
jgi:iron(III) transport system ATP-binding protein